MAHHKERLYRPWRYSSSQGEVGVFFRDHQLSDLIGFTYSQWDAGRAVADLCGRLNAIKSRLGGEGPGGPDYSGWRECLGILSPTMPTIFCRGCTQELPGQRRLNLTTCSEVLEKTRFDGRLHTIHPGSWINGSYGIWIGHPEENLAWDLLAQAREAAVAGNPAVAAALESGEPPADATAELICRSLYAAEGSDWFWWYGDDHFSPHSDRFDRLFRQHLMNIYRLLGQDPPRELLEPIKKKSPAGLIREPAAFIDPEINGRISDYFEWLAAGLYDLTRQGSAMHSFRSDAAKFLLRLQRESTLFQD